MHCSLECTWLVEFAVKRFTFVLQRFFPMNTEDIFLNYLFESKFEI